MSKARWNELTAQEMRKDHKNGMKNASAIYQAEKRGESHETHRAVSHDSNPRGHWIKPLLVGAAVIGGLVIVNKLAGPAPVVDANPCPACQQDKYALANWYTGPDPSNN